MAICPKCGQQHPKVGVACTNAICIPEGIHAIHEDEMEKAQSDPKIGQLSADKYVITGRISKGGMGAVYRAVQLPVEREVAFKVLRTEMEDSDQGRDRFIQEAKAISRLTHPNIIILHDFGFEKSGHPYMVMEYAPGIGMNEWMTQDDINTERILVVAQQLLSALEEAHQQGIVHRDLKPENVIIISKGSQRDFVKLLDFGIARIINESSTRGLTREGEVFGTPHYMAPEQAQGAKNIGPAADVYAIGIILFEMICGRPPFDADSPLAVLLKHLNEPLPPITPRAGVTITPELDAFIQRACSKNAEERFQDATEMLVALNNLLMGTNSSGRYASLTGGYIGVSSGTQASQEFAVAQTAEHDAPPIHQDHLPEVQQNLIGGGMAYDTLQDDDFAPPPSNNNTKIIAGVVVLVLLLASIGGAFAVIGQKKAKDPATAQNKTDTKTDTKTALNDTKKDGPDTVNTLNDKTNEKTDTKTDEKTDTKTDEKTDTSNLGADTKTDEKTDTKTDEKADTKTDEKTSEKADSKSTKSTKRTSKGSKRTNKGSKTETKTETKTDTKTETKTDTKKGPVKFKLKDNTTKGPVKFKFKSPTKTVKPKKFSPTLVPPP